MTQPLPLGDRPAGAQVSDALAEGQLTPRQAGAYDPDMLALAEALDLDPDQIFDPPLDFDSLDAAHEADDADEAGDVWVTDGPPMVIPPGDISSGWRSARRATGARSADAAWDAEGWRADQVDHYSAGTTTGADSGDGLPA